MVGKNVNFILCDFQSRKSKYLPTTREGNVFRSVCQSFCTQGYDVSSSLPVWSDVPWGMMSLRVWFHVLFGGLPLRRRGLPLRSVGGGGSASQVEGGVLPPGDPPSTDI